MKLKIGDVAKKALAEGATDEQALAAVLEAFPKAKTGVNSIKTYRSQLRRDVKEGKREAGKEGPPERHRVSLGPTLPGQPCRRRRQGKREMTPELAEQLREAADRKRQERFAKQLEDQRERERKRGPKIDRASLFFNAAKVWKNRTGFWPAPSDLIAAGTVPPTFNNLGPPPPSEYEPRGVQF
jgi:hypothetical protein